MMSRACRAEAERRRKGREENLQPILVLGIISHLLFGSRRDFTFVLYNK